MPRTRRLDAPGMVHHVMIRGIDRRRIFEDRVDYEALLTRLDDRLPKLGFRCFAWALMPNHAHFALETGPTPLARLMSGVQTSYALFFNQRHGRVGHLFQNRFRSRPVSDDRDLIGLVRYVHRNPLEANLVADARALEGYRWCGHGALVGRTRARRFESIAATRALLDVPEREAIRQFRRSIQGEERQLGRPFASDWTDDPRTPTRTAASDRAGLERLIDATCGRHGADRTALLHGRRDRTTSAARAEIVHRAVTELGRRQSEVARALRISECAVSRTLRRTGPKEVKERRSVPS